MSAMVPSNTPQLMRDQAELDTLRWIVRRMFAAHQRMANSQRFDHCLCSDCQQARPFMPDDLRYCSEVDEREEAS